MCFLTVATHSIQLLDLFVYKSHNVENHSVLAYPIDWIVTISLCYLQNPLPFSLRTVACLVFSSYLFSMSVPEVTDSKFVCYISWCIDTIELESPRVLSLESICERISFCMFGTHTAQTRKVMYKSYQSNGCRQRSGSTSSRRRSQSLSIQLEAKRPVGFRFMPFDV